MPIVPFSRNARNTLGQSDPVPPPMDWGLMAAAQMHSEGRLIDKYSALPMSDNIDDRRTSKPAGDHVDDAAEAAALRTIRSVKGRGDPEIPDPMNGM